MIALDTVSLEGAKIRVIGIGGGGGNAVNNMIAKGLQSVEFIAANTDKQALDYNLAQITIQIGANITNGLGTGADPEIGRKAVEENYDEIKEVLQDTDMLFVTAGMGGGTGTGGAPIIARIGQEIGALVVAIVTKPFNWEGRNRMYIAEFGIKELRQYVDALIIIENQRLLKIVDKNTSFGDAFKKVDEVLHNATKGIAEIISKHGVVNVDFADVKTIMKGMGDALMGIGTAVGEHRATEATQDALNSPLLDGISISGAKGVLVNISGGSDMKMHEVAEAVTIVEEAAGENVNLIHGVVYGSEPSDEIMVTVVATGFKKYTEEEIHAEVQSEEDIEQLLPFDTANEIVDESIENRIYTPPDIVQKIHRFAINGAVNKSHNSPEQIGKPKGDEELEYYDRPAYERRGISSETSANNQNENNNDELVVETVETKKNSIKPEYNGFLKTIMD
jgi:cell division protein FtsZ